MKTRKQEEINRQIEGLLAMRSTVPARSVFDDDNHGMIDAQLSVLRGEKRPEQFSDDVLFHEADRAREWMKGENNDDLFEW